MIIKVTDRKGQTAYVDNEGQVNGGVKIQGDSALVSHLNRVLNLDIYLPFGGQRAEIADTYLTKENDLTVLYKASNIYITNHFIPVECMAFGYSAEILKG